MNSSRTTAERDARHVDGTLDAETAIRDRAARQHGVVTRSQMLADGVPAYVIDFRVKKRRLRQLHRGVYGVGPVPTPQEPRMAAVLACGERALLSHRSAAATWRLGGARMEAAEVHVSVRRTARQPGPGVILHRVTDLRDDEATVLDGIPITTPARTILDLAAGVSARELEQAIAEAERANLTTRGDLLAMLSRHPRRPGAPLLRAVLALDGGPAFVRSEPEAMLLALLRKAGAPIPELNVRVEGFEVDCLWRKARLIVEIDGRAYHGDARAFERDRDRDGILTGAGYRVIRVTWRQLTKEPEALLFRLGQALARG